MDGRVEKPTVPEKRHLAQSLSQPHLSKPKEHRETACSDGRASPPRTAADNRHPRTHRAPTMFEVSTPAVPGESRREHQD
jgi:hypothetical protein